MEYITAAFTVIDIFNLFFQKIKINVYNKF